MFVCEMENNFVAVYVDIQSSFDVFCFASEFFFLLKANLGWILKAGCLFCKQLPARYACVCQHKLFLFNIFVLFLFFAFVSL